MVEAKYRKKAMPRKNSKDMGAIKSTTQMSSKALEIMARYRGDDRLQQIAKQVKENEKNRKDWLNTSTRKFVIRLMILIDLNQVSINNLMVHIRFNGGVIDPTMIREMVLRSLLNYRKKFYEQYGELVICSDSRNVWRKQEFPQYKANRKKDRKSDVHDWKEIFDTMTQIREELAKFFPYKVLNVDTAEADDIIATIIMHERLTNDNNDPILIVSGDKDFAQLQRYGNVHQYSPNTKKWIVDDNPLQTLKEHIIRGDASDGVPNILSDDDTLVSERRQKQIFKKKVNEWLPQKPNEFCDSFMLRNYKRNEKLIDLSKIPNDLYSKIVTLYNEDKSSSRSRLMTYFMTHNLRELSGQISEF